MISHAAQPGQRPGIGKKGPVASKYAKAAAMLIQRRAAAHKFKKPQTPGTQEGSPYAQIANGQVGRKR